MIVIRLWIISLVSTQFLSLRYSEFDVYWDHLPPMTVLLLHNVKHRFELVLVPLDRDLVGNLEHEHKHTSLLLCGGTYPASLRRLSLLWFSKTLQTMFFSLWFGEARIKILI